MSGAKTGASEVRRRRMIGTLRWVYLFVVAAALAWLLHSRWREIAGIVRGIRPGIVAIALALAFGQFGLNALFWSRGLQGLGQPATWGAVLVASAQSVPARYVPGSIWYAVGRGGLLWARGISGAAIATVAILENILSVLVVFALGPALQALGGNLSSVPRWLLAFAPALLVLGSPPVVNHVLGRFGSRTCGHRVDWRCYLELGGWMALFWCWSATTFTVYLWSFPGLRWESPLFVAGSFMVAWGAGFLAVFAPQGIGVFELALAALLAGDQLLDLAVLVAGYRLLMLFRDGALALVAGVAGLRSQVSVDPADDDREA